jgi:hypothetical protein
MTQPFNNASITAQRCISLLAHIQTTQRHYMGEVFGSHIYGIVNGWQAEEIKSALDVEVVSSVMQLRHAMDNPDIHSIFIPARKALTFHAAKNVLAQSSLDKTIFWENV